MRNAYYDDELAFSNSIQHRESGRLLPTLVQPASLAELTKLPDTWLFDWVKESSKYQVYKLVTVENPAIIQGLVSFEKRKGFYQLLLVESAPFNKGRQKENEGAAGNLFAFICKLSDEHGFDGVVGFESKTDLIEHYQKSLGAVQIGYSNRMFIGEIEARNLINKYFPK